jgi:adenosylcobinamide-GDP ribazoletransferase
VVRLTGLLAATQFLTRIPIRLRREPDVAASVPWFPVVGAIVGGVVGGVGAGLWHLVPPLVAASVAIAFGLLITGAFHEDGLADVADAFGGGWTVERRLEILKDSRHGSYGVAALCSSIVVRVVCLGSMPGPAAIAGALAGVAIAAIAVGWWVGPLVGAMLASIVGVRWLAMHKIGGISGDVLGTCEQIAECLGFVVLSGLATHHPLWWR